MYVKRIQAKYKKLLLELEFLYSDLEYHEDIMAEAIVEFQKAVMLYCKNNNINYEKDLVKNEEQRPSASDPESVRFYDEDGNPTDEASVLAEQRWENVLGEIIYGLKCAKTIQNYDYEDKEEVKKLTKSSQRSFELIGKHLFNLWD